MCIELAHGDREVDMTSVRMPHVLAYRDVSQLALIR
jgi:hypothetical protein